MSDDSPEDLRELVRTVNADLGRIVAPDGISVGEHLLLGGLEQWVSIRGQDRSAPILLFLHGGPGSPVSDISYSYQRPWEDFFVVVNWDQRGFGRSAGSYDQVAGTLNRKQYVSDAVELIEHLCRRLAQDKVVLVGQSFGTVLALEVAQQRPDLLHVVVTQGLAANWMASPRLLWQAMLERAESDADDAESTRLRELGPPPPPDAPQDLLRWPREFGIGFPDENTWHNIRGEGDGWHRRIDVLRRLSPDLPVAEYDEQERRAGDPEWRARYEEAMTSVLPWDARRDVGTELDVPFVVMMGSHDWQTATSLARAYFDEVQAPWKKWVELPHAAHALNIEQPGLVVVSLVNDVLPATYGERPSDALT